jgi:membrane dipeptidase
VIYLAHDHMDRAEDFARDLAGGVSGKVLHMVVDSWFDAPTREQYEASYYGYAGFLQRGLAAITKALAIADNPANQVRIVRTAADLDSAERSGQLALMLGTEGGKLIEEDLANLEAFWRLGLRHVQLNWAMRNQIGASQSNENEPDQPGLTPFGFQVIERMNELGMVVDVSHSAPQTISDVLRTTRKPVLNSHSGSRVIADKQQNLWDDQIRDMARNGGVIGIHFCSRLVLGVNDRQATIPDLMRQVRYVVDVGGIDVVGLGPDFILGNPPRDEHYRRNTNQDNITWTKGLESSDELGNLLPGLEDAGFSASDIERILGGNLLRLFREVLPGRS